MGKLDNVTFTGASGKKYVFEAYPPGTEFNNVGMVYIFAEQYSNDGTYYYPPKYIGETSHMQTRWLQHQDEDHGGKWPCAQRNGANCVCVMVEANDAARMAVETDLRHNYSTPCNDQ